MAKVYYVPYKFVCVCVCVVICGYATDTRSLDLI